MTILPAKVNPGDLITADFMNRVLDNLNSMDIRLAALESSGTVSGTVTITSLVPAGPVAVGAQLLITGRNFGLPGTNVVTMDNISVPTTVPGNSDTLLFVTVPLLQGVPPAGKTVTLTVSNPMGFASASLTVIPAQATIADGSLLVTLSQSPADPKLLAGQSYNFVFTVKAITNMQDVFTLEPIVDVGWAAIVVDAGNTAILPPQIVIPKSDPPAGTSRDVRVRVTIPAGTAAGTAAKVTLRVKANSNPLVLVGTSPGDTITVDAPAPPPQKIPITASQVITPSNALPATLNKTDKVVTIPTVDKFYRVDFMVDINDLAFVLPDPVTGAPQTTYNVTLTDPANNWTAKISGAGPATPFASVLNPTTANSTNIVKVLLKANAGATIANLVLRVEKAGDATFFGTISLRIQTN